MSRSTTAAVILFIILLVCSYRLIRVNTVQFLRPRIYLHSSKLQWEMTRSLMYAFVNINNSLTEGDYER